MQPTETPGPNKSIAAWCLYDWANSAFTTLVVTFIYATYFSKAFADNEALGTALWSRGVAISSILIAILSPIFGAVADRGGRRRRYLLTSTLVCVGATTLLTFVSPSQSGAVWIALTLFIFGNVAFEMGMVFYNAFLPSLAKPERIGRISGYGWAMGYAGGLVCMIIALLGFIGLGDTEPWFALSQEDGFHVRATNLLVAAWFLIFSLPFFIWVKEEPGTQDGGGIDIGRALGDLKQTVVNIRRYGEVVKFLVARLIYNDGLITIFAFGGIYAAGTFDMPQDEIIMFGIVLNVAAGCGAWAFGFFDDRLGGKTTIMVSIVLLICSSAIAVMAPNKTWFWVAGIITGIVAGPNQSASRSLMGRFVPEKHKSEFFGFFAFSGKASAFLGPLLLGFVSVAYGQRVGMGTVIAFFVIGGLLLMLVNEQKGIAGASQSVK